MPTTIGAHYDLADTGYKVSARDILTTLEDLPTMHGPKPYAVAYREATRALVQEILGKCYKGRIAAESIYKNRLLKDLKARSLFWTSRLDCAIAQHEGDLDYQERCLALSEFFATAYDLIHEEL